MLECSWDALQAALDGAADLDEVIAAHDDFLQALVSKSLVARSHAPLFGARALSTRLPSARRPLTAASFTPPLRSGALSQIFEAILSFCKAQDELYLALLEHKAAARQHAAAVQEQTAAGRWGCEGSLDAAGRLGSGASSAPPPTVSPTFRRALAASASQYRQRFVAFFRQLTAHEALELAFLSFRLDFNGYYAVYERDEADAAATAEAAALAADVAAMAAPE